MVLENVTEVWYEAEERKSRQTEMLLLNGHDIAFVRHVRFRWCRELTRHKKLIKKRLNSKRKNDNLVLN